MTDIRQAAQQALEALLLPTMKTQQMLIQRDEAIIALRRALEQPTVKDSLMVAKPEQRKPLTDDVLVPLEVLEAAANSLDSFCGNLGWGDADLQTLDNLFAIIEQHKAAHNIKEKTNAA